MDAISWLIFRVLTQAIGTDAILVCVHYDQQFFFIDSHIFAPAIGIACAGK
jgi:hypothetical protein